MFALQSVLMKKKARVGCEGGELETWRLRGGSLCFESDSEIGRGEMGKNESQDLYFHKGPERKPSA